jgi:hypothetical protein
MLLTAREDGASGCVVTARIGHDEPDGHFDHGITGRG